MTTYPTVERESRFYDWFFPLGPVRAWLFILAVATTSVGVWAYDIASFEPLSSPFSLEWWQLAIAFYLAEVYVVHLQFRKQAHTLSLTEFGLVFGLFFVSPAALFAAQFVGAGVALAVHRRQRPMKLAFNLAELPLCSGIALLVFRSFYGGDPNSMRTWALVLIAAAVAHTVGVVLVSAVIAVVEARLAAPQLAQTLAISLIGALATASLGLAGVLLIVTRPEAGLLLVLPAVTCALAFRAYMTQREQREHLEFLYESMRATQGAPEFGLAVGQLLVAARRLLRADYAEILFVSPTAGEPALRSVSGGSGESLMHPVELSGVDSHAVGRIGGMDHPLMLSRATRERRVRRVPRGTVSWTTRSSARFAEKSACSDSCWSATESATSARSRRPTGRCSRHSRVMPASCSRTGASNTPSPRSPSSRKSSAIRPTTTRSPAFRTACCSQIASRRPSRMRVPGARTPSSSSTSTASRSSTTAGVTRSATSCSCRSPRGSEARCAPRTCLRGSAATSSPCCSRTQTQNRPSMRRKGSSEALEAAFSLDGREARLHASIGIAVTGPHAETAEELHSKRRHRHVRGQE